MTADELKVVADMLKRFSTPRAYAGDYHMDFAIRIDQALKEYNEQIRKKEYFPD